MLFGLSIFISLIILFKLLWVIFVGNSDRLFRSEIKSFYILDDYAFALLMFEILSNIRLKLVSETWCKFSYNLYANYKYKSYGLDTNIAIWSNKAWIPF